MVHLLERFEETGILLVASLALRVGDQDPIDTAIQATETCAFETRQQLTRRASSHHSIRFQNGR